MGWINFFFSGFILSEFYDGKLGGRKKIV